jgi:hypothetical protein
MRIPSLSTDPDVTYHRYRNFPTEDRRGGTVGSHSDVTMLSRKASAKSNANSSIRAWTLDGSAGVSHGIHIRSDSPAPDHPVRDACGSGMPVINSSAGHERDIISNEVMAPRMPQHFRIQKRLTTRSHSMTVMEILAATFAHIFCTSRISPFLLRSSTDALQEVGLFFVSF